MNFTITMEPTAEMFEAPINGVKVPVRIWAGVTSGGVKVEAYVLSITPNDDADAAKMKAELPGFMVPSRAVYSIDTRSVAEKRAQAIHETGWDPTN